MSSDEVRIRRVVSNFIFHTNAAGKRKLLLLKRSEKVRNYQGLWCTVSGSIDGSESPRDCAVREIEEEIGVEHQDLTLLCQGTEMVVEAKERQIAWHVTPFMWQVKHDRVNFDWEHTEYSWIDPGTLDKYELVPDLEKTYHQVTKEHQSSLSSLSSTATKSMA